MLIFRPNELVFTFIPLFWNLNMVTDAYRNALERENTLETTFLFGAFLSSVIFLTAGWIDHDQLIRVQV